MICPRCHHEFSPTNPELAQELGRRTSDRKAAAARVNGRLGGRPKKQKQEPGDRREEEK